MLEQMSAFAQTIYNQRYAWKDENGTPIETWESTAYRVVFHVLNSLGFTPSDVEFQKLVNLIAERKFIPGGRYLYASGRDLHQTQNCLLLKAQDSREGWAELLHNSAMALQTGAGIGIDYSDIRPNGAPIRRTGGTATGPICLMRMINEIGRGVMQGGTRRSAIWAGLRWNHPDCDTFIRCKDWSEDVRRLKEKDFLFPADMEFTNISVILDDDFFEAYEDRDHLQHKLAHKIYNLTVKQMVKKAEPGFSVDVADNIGESLRNACTEITSSDDSDICNLGSINLARIGSKEELKDAINLSTLFLIAGTVYSDVPYGKVEEIRRKNRRLGLGIMGVHEWLLTRNYNYGPNEELGEWLEIYAQSTKVASKWAKKYNLSEPVKTRAIAPTGTIGIIAETTTGIEPIFCVAFKRRYMVRDGVWNYQYVIDPTAKRLIQQGVDPDAIEDAYSLSYDVERRVAFQAWVQQYVDHGISSTINLPGPILHDGEQDKFRTMLYKYLPQLRGITCYPDGARGGQPLTAVPYHEAVRDEGVIFEEVEEKCTAGVCGI